MDCYLRNSETIYRILHVPTFRRDYEALWVSDTNLDTSFLVQLKLVLAIGAATFDQQFSQRPSAIGWIYEAQTWVSEPNFKSRSGIQSLQTELLLLVARELVGIGGDSIWVSAGGLFRRAIDMGLHRDPAPLSSRASTIFAAEMHRRLWNTVLEITLQSSMTAGGPPLMSLSDFDTEPPGNFDDEQLLADDPIETPNEDFTHVLIAIALRKTFPLRLAAAKFLNDLGSTGTYEEMLRIDAELRGAYKILCRTLQRCAAGSGRSPSQFEKCVVDLLMYRYLSALHVPFFGSVLQEAAYAYSRRVVVESSLKIWYTACPSPSPSILAHQSRRDLRSADGNDITKLTMCASGFYRTVAMQAAVLIAGEVRAQLQEEDSLGPILLRPDLFCVLEDAKAWCLRSIEAGETNIKGYLLVCIIAAQIDGLIQGIGEAELRELLVKAVEDAEERCLPVLEGMATQGQTEGNVEWLRQISLNPEPEPMEDWDFMVSTASAFTPVTNYIS